MQTIYRRLGIEVPRLQIVLGSGFGGALDELGVPSGWQEAGSARFGEIEGLETATVSGHPGVFRFYRHEASRKIIAFQVGRLHGYEGNTPQTVVAPVLRARLAGVPEFVLTNAAGGINANYRVGSVMLIKDHVNMTGTNSLIGPNPAHGPRFPDMSGTYDSEMRGELRKQLSKQGLNLEEGIYLGLYGPTFETPAEVKLFAQWGMDAVGMSTVWEAIALKHAGARLSGLSLISNAACGLGDGKPLEHERIVEESGKAAKKIVSALFEFAATRLGSPSQ